MQDSRTETCSIFGSSVQHCPNAYRSLVPVVMPPGHLHGLGSASFSAQGLKGHSLPWNHGDGSTTQSRSSASSTVVSPCEGDSKTSSGSSSHGGGSVLKEHDYIGLAEVSSSSVPMKVSTVSELDLKPDETDLRLGLGPPDPLHSSDAKMGDRPRANGSAAVSSLVQAVSCTDDGSEKRNSEVPRQAQFLRSMEGIRAPFAMDFPKLQAPLSGQEFDATRYAVLNGYPACRFAFQAAKNGVKRAYDEAMTDKRYNHGEIRNGSFEGMAWPAPNAQILAPNPEPELSHLPQQAMLQTPPFAYQWAFAPFLPVQNKSIGNIASRPDSAAVDSSAPAWDSSSKPPECILPAESSVLPCQPSSIENRQSASRDAPSQKGPVVGWPPIRSFRKNTLAAHSKTAEDGEGPNEAPDGIPGTVKPSPAALYVKVNMDGVPIGRKVDLNAHQSYEALTLALEEMFQRSNTGHETVNPELMRSQLINGSDFVLTYEDKEGDWMLVGDVPWGMFVSTVRRLRLMKASEATGLVPRRSRR